MELDHLRVPDTYLRSLLFFNTNKWAETFDQSQRGGS